MTFGVVLSSFSRFWEIGKLGRKGWCFSNSVDLFGFVSLDSLVTKTYAKCFVVYSPLTR